LQHKGLDHPAADTISKKMQGFVAPVKDYNYKIVVLNTFNATKNLITEAYNYGLRPSMCAGAFAQTKMLSGMIMPYVSQESNSITVLIIEKIEILSRQHKDLESFSFSELVNFLDMCADIVIMLTPLLNYIGISNKQIRIGTFSFPGEQQPDKAVTDYLEEDDD